MRRSLQIGSANKMKHKWSPFYLNGMRFYYCEKCKVATGKTDKEILKEEKSIK